MNVMRMNLSIFGALLLAYQPLASWSKETIRVDIDLIATSESAASILNEYSAKPYYQYCDSVSIDAEQIRNFIRRLAADSALLESTTVTISLPKVEAIEYIGVDAQTYTDWPNREHFRWVGQDAESRLASFRIHPYKRVRGTFFSASTRFELHTSPRTADSVLCEWNHEFKHKID